MNKITYRIPTREQYAYIEMTMETDEFVSKESIVENYEALTTAVRGGPGIPIPEFRHLIDDFLAGRPYTTVDGTPFVGDDIMALLPKLNPDQKMIYDALGRAKARAK